MAYSLTSSVDLQVHQMWIGSGSNGKTYLQDLLAKLVGPTLSTSFNIRQFMKDVGYITITRGKRYAYASEIGGNFLQMAKMEALKRIMTEPTLDARSAFEKKQSWNNETKYIWATNYVPIVEVETDKAFWRRWMFVFFNVSFEGDDKDPQRFSDILKYEGSDVISYLLNEVNWKDIELDDWEETRDTWLNLSSTFREFINDKCILDSTENIQNKKLYDEYTLWCNSKGVEETPRDTIKKILKRLNILQEDFDKNDWHFMGIGLKNDYAQVETFGLSDI